MKRYLAAFVVLIASYGATSAPPVAEMKCDQVGMLFPNAPQTVFVLNAKISSREAVQQLRPDSVESIEVVCAESLHRAFGIESARDGVSVFTIPGPAAALRHEMLTIVQLQTAYFQKHGTFAKHLTDLPWSDPSGLIRVDLDTKVDGTSWTAQGTHRYRMSPHSAVVVSGSPDRVPRLP